MPINFPYPPSLNQLYSYDGKTWEWNGIYWEVYSALTSYITSAYTAGNGYSAISGLTGGNIVLKSFSGVNITITDSGDKLTFSSSTTSSSVSGDYLPLSGGTVTGGTIFQSGLTANTISATAYYNLPPLYQLTGGTYSTGTINFNNTTGGTSFSVTGLSKYFVTGSTPTGYTLVNGDRWFDTNTGIELVWVTDVDGSQWIQPTQGGEFIGNYLPLSGGTVTGDTIFQSGITATTISATTYYNFPINIVSSSCVVANDGSLYFGSSKGGWSYWEWDTQLYGGNLNYSDSFFGIPLPFDVPNGSNIVFSGIAYSDATTKIVDDIFEFNVYYFECGNFRYSQIGSGSGNFDSNGIFCFGNDFQLSGIDLYTCCSFLLVSFGVTTKESDGSIVKISFKLTT